MLALIPLLPLGGFLVNAFLGKRLPKSVSGGLATVVMAISFIISVMQVLYEGLSDSKYRPCPLLVKYVEANWLGRKTGRGFYDYSKTPPTPTR